MLSSTIINATNKTVNENNANIIVSSPIFIIKSYALCFECGKDADVWGLASPTLKDCEVFDDDEPITDVNLVRPYEGFFVLSQIGHLPKDLLKEIKQRTALFFLDDEKEYNLRYYANHCKCGAMFSDYDIFHPGEAFSPMQKISCEGITIERLPVEGEFRLSCSYSNSSENLILDYAERINF
jgi:hypothetical protein